MSVVQAVAASSLAPEHASAPSCPPCLQREQALAVAHQEKAQLQRDQQLMLAARGALASLHASLQHAAVPCAAA